MAIVVALVSPVIAFFVFQDILGFTATLGIALVMFSGTIVFAGFGIDPLLNRLILGISAASLSRHGKEATFRIANPALAKQIAQLTEANRTQMLATVRQCQEGQTS